MNAMPDLDVTPAQLVATYIALRDQKKAAEEQFETFLREHYTERMKDLEIQLLDILNKLGVESIASTKGTAYRKESVSVTIADQREFRRHVIGDEAWELADWRANKTAIEALVENNEPLPPGVNRTTFASVGIRRKS
jgi:hypothetical protein